MRAMANPKTTRVQKPHLGGGSRTFFLSHQCHPAFFRRFGAVEAAGSATSAFFFSRPPGAGCIRLRLRASCNAALQGFHQIDDLGRFGDRTMRRRQSFLSSPRLARAARPDSGPGSSPARTRPIGGATTRTLVVRLACLRPEQDALRPHCRHPRLPRNECTAAAARAALPK